MKLEAISSKKGSVSRCILEGTERIDSPEKFLDALMNAGSDILVVGAEDLAAEFFNLRSGLAGEMLQKVSNYAKRLVVLGDFSRLKSGALKDFMYESNRGGRVVFADTLESAIELLR